MIQARLVIGARDLTWEKGHIGCHLVRNSSVSSRPTAHEALISVVCRERLPARPLEIRRYQTRRASQCHS